MTTTSHTTTTGHTITKGYTTDTTIAQTMTSSSVVSTATTTTRTLMVTSNKLSSGTTATNASTVVPSSLMSTVRDTVKTKTSKTNQEETHAPQGMFQMKKMYKDNIAEKTNLCLGMFLLFTIVAAVVDICCVYWCLVKNRLSGRK